MKRGLKESFPFRRTGLTQCHLNEKRIERRTRPQSSKKRFEALNEKRIERPDGKVAANADFKILNEKRIESKCS